MKIRYTFILFSLISITTQAQNFQLTFEDTTVINRVFYTDSLLDPQGIWQIGKPNKVVLDSALTVPNAVTTLTDSFLPQAVRASFIITLVNVQLAPYEGGMLSFAHHYQFDSYHGGGNVEFSVDTGRHWHPIHIDTIRQTCFNAPFNGQGYGSLDTIDGQIIPSPVWWDTIHKANLLSGVPYFSGTHSDWIYDTIAFPTFFWAEKTTMLTQYMFRFSVFTDSVSAPSQGWSIDNINFAAYGYFCGGGINDINSAHLKVYPDPATDAFHISMTDLHTSDYEVTICDLSGRVVMRQSFQGQELQMHRHDTDAGSYLIQVRDLRTGDSFQKRIVFE